MTCMEGEEGASPPVSKNKDKKFEKILQISLLIISKSCGLLQPMSDRVKFLFINMLIVNLMKVNKANQKSLRHYHVQKCSNQVYMHI